MRKLQKHEQRVQVVLSHYARPENIGPIAVKFREMDCRLLLVDNHKAGVEEAVNYDVFDDVYRLYENHGPAARFIAALGSNCPLTLFWDDDALPTADVVKAFLEEHDRLDGNYATLGRIGREYVRRRKQWRYASRNVKPKESRFVDLTCRMHFCKTEHVAHAVRFKHLILESTGYDAERLIFEDDMLLCQGIQHFTGLASRMTSWPGRPWKEMPDGEASSALPDHKSARTNFINAAHQVGWRRPAWSSL